MSYQERITSIEELPKLIEVLDSDEGIRIDNEMNRIFINKISHRYCMNVSKKGKEEFFYAKGPKEVLDFIKKMINTSSKFYSY